MDRLLELVLRRFVRRGNLRVTTASGSVFHFGDGTGRAGRGALHQHGRAARRDARSRAQARRSLHGRHAADRGRHDRRPACARARPDARRHAAGLGAAAMVRCAISTAGCSSSTCRPGRGAMSLTTTISTAGSIRCSSTPTGNTPAPISRRPTSRSTTPSSPRSATSPPSCCSKRRTSACSTSAAAGAGLRSISPNSAARTSPASRCRSEQLASAQAARRRKEPGRRGRIPHAGLSRHRRNVRPHRLGRHVRARRPRLLRRVLPQMRRAAGRRRRDAAAFDRPLRGAQRHQSLDRQVHLPRRLYPGAVGGAAGDRARGPAGHRHRDPAAALRRDAAKPGATASSRTATRPSGSTTSASCGCGSSIWPPPRWRSASRP